MDANSLTIYLPVQSMFLVSKNEVTIFKSLDCEKREESFCDIEEMRRREAYMSTIMAPLSYDSFCIRHHKIELVSGESVILKIKSSNVSGYFHARARKARLEKIFLVDDPRDRQVRDAALKVCAGNKKIIVVTNELPDLAERMHSFQSIWPELEHTLGLSPDADRKVISCLAKAGLYFKQGEVRCNGCRYRKTLKDFLANIVDSRSIRLMRLTTKLLLKTALVSSVGHDSSQCFNARNKKKTLLSTRNNSSSGGKRVEQGHFWVYQRDQKNYYHLPDSYPEPVTFEQARRRRSISGDCDFDRYLAYKKNTFLFVTTVPKSSFLSQDDLLYEGSIIKSFFATFGQKYDDLKVQVDQLLKNKPSLADELNLPPLEGLLSDKMGRFYFRIIAELWSRRDVKQLNLTPVEGLLSDKMGRFHSRIIADLWNGSVKRELGHDKAALKQLLDEWLAMIEQCDGIVAEKGLICLCVQNGGEQQCNYFHYDSSDDSSSDFSGSSSDFSGSSVSRDLSNIRRLLLWIGTEYMGFLSAIILSPLMDIFHPLELSHDILRKILCSSETCIEALTTCKSTAMDNPPDEIT